MKRAFLIGLIVMLVGCSVAAYAGDPKPASSLDENPVVYGVTYAISFPFAAGENAYDHFKAHNDKINIKDTQVGYQKDAVGEPSIPFRAARP